MLSTARQESITKFNLSLIFASFIRKTKIRIWTNHRKGQFGFTNRGIFSCLYGCDYGYASNVRFAVDLPNLSRSLLPVMV